MINVQCVNDGHCKALARSYSFVLDHTYEGLITNEV